MKKQVVYCCSITVIFVLVSIFIFSHKSSRQTNCEEATENESVVQQQIIFEENEDEAVLIEMLGRATLMPFFDEDDIEVIPLDI